MAGNKFEGPEESTCGLSDYLKVLAHRLSITRILDSTPPDAWFHLLEGSKNPVLDNRTWGPGQMNVYERMHGIRMLSHYPGQRACNLGLQCFL